MEKEAKQAYASGRGDGSLAQPSFSGNAGRSRHPLDNNSSVQVQEMKRPRDRARRGEPSPAIL
eukprot:4733133-Heterocapsa_arctica.AAC.1